jgi:4-hydroxybenzoate polyprenyltransferase
MKHKYLSIEQNKNNYDKNLLYHMKNEEINEEETLLQIVEKKRTGFLKIIRCRNIFPTFLLCFSGGWIMSPSMVQLWSNIHFLVSTISTILIMSASMIMNDLFDKDIDTFNMSRRPLVTREVTKWEAILYTFFLLTFAEFLSLHFLTPNLQDIIHFSIISLFLYTPIFKKITLIKNVFSAFFVAFAFFLGGNASSKYILTLNPNFGIFCVLFSLIFFGSIYNEILLDIRDYDGDKFYNVKTLPVVIGKNNTWIVSGILLFYNILSNTFSLMYAKGVDTGVILPFIFVPVLQTFYAVKQNYFSKESIFDAVNSSSGKSFIIILLYFYLLAYS